MSRKNRTYLFIFLAFAAALPFSNTHAQTRKNLSSPHAIDSLRKVVRSSKEDTNKVKTLDELGWVLRLNKPDTALILCNQALQLINALPNTSSRGQWLLAKTYNNIGVVYRIKGDYPMALDYLFKTFAIWDQLSKLYPESKFYKRYIATISGNIGSVYEDKGEYPKALEYDIKALKQAEEVGSKEEIGRQLCNVGIIYNDEGDYANALEYFSRALKLDEARGDSMSAEHNYENIGIVYAKQKDFKTSFIYFSKAAQMAENAGDKDAMAYGLGNIGSLFVDEGDAAAAKGDLNFAIKEKYPEALNYFLKSLKTREELGTKNLIASTLGEIGSLYIKTKRYKEAEQYLLRGLAVSDSIGTLETTRNIENSMSELYYQTGRYADAYKHYKVYVAARDSLFNKEKTMKIVSEQMQYEFDKKQAAEKAEQDKKDAVAGADKRRQGILTASVSFGLLVVLAFSGLLFSRFRITQKQKQIIEEQKNLVEEKNKEVLDSITYAKRLQDAILPPLSVIKKYLPESFVLYKPKDIVAGDFYWLEKAGDSILIAAADCTGHGVPGAMVSVVCSNALNRAVKEFGITEPGKILDKTRELVLETFGKSEGNIQDGMDISLASVTASPVIARNEAISTVDVRLPRPDDGSRSDDREVRVQWSGAYNSLWYISNGEMKEIAGDKQPIGKTDNLKPFTTHTITLSPQGGPVVLYLFTDGYADQFGGPKGKKFKYKQLQEKLSVISSLPMAEQKRILEETFENWKGGLEQTDDVCVIGIRMS